LAAGAPVPHADLVTDNSRNVRRFAAIDMYGTAGTQRRRRIVLLEFVVGTVALLLIGAVLLIHGGWLWAAWLLGCGLNYGALAVHAVTLYPPGRLEAELAGADVGAELRRYSIAQLLLFVPVLIAIVAVAQAARHGGPGRDSSTA
jgi:hypothetical protein